MNNLKVVFFGTNFFGNPYKDLLIKHLNYLGVQGKEDRCHALFIQKVIGEGKPDILHLDTVHYFLLGNNKIHRWLKFLFFIIQILILKLIGIRVVWTVHEWSDRFEDGKQEILPIWAATLGRIFDAVITHCETTKNEITKAFRLENKNKIFVVYHGNYIDSYENKISQLEARKALGIPNENLVFLVFGTIHRTKGFLEAIDAFKRLQEESISLLIVGYPAEEQIEEMIVEKIKDYKNILFVPKRVQDDEIQIYMNACDCVVFPYKVFTTSGVAILAISFGKACIAPEGGYFSDVLDETGTFFHNSTKEDSLMSAMKCAVENKNNLGKMGQHNLKLAEQWNWDYVAKETFNIYQRCLGRL